jgi:hypothetical protein
VLTRKLALVVAASVLLWSAAPGALAAADPGVVFELDRAHFTLTVRDQRSGEALPPIPVVLGSPAHPTPGGVYPLELVILNPAWQPGPAARAAGASREAASLVTPMGVAKIPFAAGGAIALHGGGDPHLLGKPVSSGCVRASDADLLRTLAWLVERGALGLPERRPDGEIVRPFERGARLIVR